MIDRVFAHALNTVKKIPRTGSTRPPSRDRLKLYGLYKQSMGEFPPLDCHYEVALVVERAVSTVLMRLRIEGDVDGVMARPDEDEGEESERQKW